MQKNTESITCISLVCLLLLLFLISSIICWLTAFASPSANIPAFGMVVVLSSRNIDKTIREQEVLNRISLLGDIIVYVKHLGGTAGFVLYVRAGAEDKIATLSDLLKPL